MPHSGIVALASSKNFCPHADGSAALGRVSDVRRRIRRVEAERGHHEKHHIVDCCGDCDLGVYVASRSAPRVRQGISSKRIRGMPAKPGRDWCPSPPPGNWRVLPGTGLLGRSPLLAAPLPAPQRLALPVNPSTMARICGSGLSLDRISLIELEGVREIRSLCVRLSVTTQNGEGFLLLINDEAQASRPMSDNCIGSFLDIA
jgi:hypothetical protein